MLNRRGKHKRSLRVLVESRLKVLLYILLFVTLAVKSVDGFLYYFLIQMLDF